jgi:hypothetical protein
MKRFAFILIAFVLACGIFYSISQVLKPKPISKMNPTRFKQPEQIGAVVYRRLRQDVRKAPLVILGSSPWVDDYDKIWSGLLLTAYSDKKFPKLLYQDIDLKPLEAIKDMEVKTLDWNEEIPGNTKPMEIHVVHTVYSESWKNFSESYVRRTHFAPGAEPLTITLLPFAVNDEELAKMEPVCPLDQVSHTDMEQLGCMIKRVSRQFARKKLKPEGLWAILEQHGAREYLLFVHEPAVEEPQPEDSGESF